MIKLADIGNFETLPQIVLDIKNGNIDALEAYFTSKKIETPIPVGQHSSYSPLDYAIITNNFPAIQWLVSHGADVNAKYNHSFLKAVRYCDEKVIRYLIDQGAETEGDDPNAPDAFEQALYGKKYHHLPLIEELGHSVRQYGGNAFRSLIKEKNYKMMDFFIAHGVDINHQEKDMVYSMNSTPLCVAARWGYLDVCQYLVAHGADPLLAEKDGMRPYSIALEQGHEEMAAYFKSLEPEEFHQLQNKLDALRSYKLPKNLLDFLQGDNLRIDFEPSEDCNIKYLEFFTLTDTIPMKIGRLKVLRISKTLDNYSDLYILWIPKTKSIAGYDYEHEELYQLGSFDAFKGNMKGHICKIINGEYGE
jgi:ankyrin repeat protein